MLRGLLVLLIGLGVTTSWIGFEEASWGRLQRFYFQTYLSSTYQNRNCRLLYVLYPNGWRVACDRDVDRGTTSARDHEGAFPFVLSKDAVKTGAKRLEWREFSSLSSAAARKYLQSEIYAGQTPLQLIAWPIVLGLLFTGGLLGVMLWRQARGLRDGMRVKLVRGPHLVSCSEFNSRKESDGIGFEIIENTGTIRRFLSATPERTMLRVRSDEETSHFILIGDSGTGKSSLIRQLLTQLRSRGEGAIVYDPATEFTPQFYDPVSDTILNPTDRRMPFWTPSDEVRHPVDAAALASSLFPEKLGDKNFFTDSAKKIFAHLLRYRPTPQELTHWMRNIDELDKRVAGTEFEAMIRKSAAAQRAAVQGTFNQAAAAFHLLPAEADTKVRWTAAKWAEEKKGWIFLPSMPAFRESLRPLTSMWLDSVIMRLMDSTKQPESRVWLILDELSSLQRLPQLPAAMTESRKWNMCIVLGLQGRSQLEAIYGPQSEAMLSQPMTKVFLRTSEPNAAQWVSRSIGEVELLRREDAHTWNYRLFSSAQRGATTQMRRYTEPLVLASTIQGLPNLTGYVRSKDLVVPAVFGYKEFKQIHSGFEPRELPELEPLSLVEAPVEERKSGIAARRKAGRKNRKEEQQAPPSQIKIFE
jgi:hypothetical protein